jgi:hypothetical protein
VLFDHTDGEKRDVRFRRGGLELWECHVEQRRSKDAQVNMATTSVVTVLMGFAAFFWRVE